MKKFYILLFLIFIAGHIFSQNQNEVRASMGIDFVSIPQLKDYLEFISGESHSDFNSAINFSGSYGRMLSETGQIELEVSYLLSSFNFNLIDGNYDLTYSVVMPSVLYNYVLNESSYNFKFGGGFGPRFLNVSEKQLPFQTDYSKIGFGFILRGVGNTAIAQNVYAHIGADIRYDIFSKLEENENINSVGNVNFDALSFGLRLGISYQF